MVGGGQEVVGGGQEVVGGGQEALGPGQEGSHHQVVFTQVQHLQVCTLD